MRCDIIVVVANLSGEVPALVAPVPDVRLTGNLSGAAPRAVEFSLPDEKTPKLIVRLTNGPRSVVLPYLFTGAAI